MNSNREGDWIAQLFNRQLETEKVTNITKLSPNCLTETSKSKRLN